jgi:hypothetical protein
MRRVLTISAASFPLFATAICESKSSDDGFKVSQRLRSGLNKGILRERFKAKNTKGSQESPLKVYTLFNKQGQYKFEGEGSLPIARVATIEINGSPDAVADLFESSNHRNEWDKTCAESQKTITKDGLPIHYFRGKPGLVVPARTFVYTQSRLSGAVVGKDYSAIVIFCKDAHDQLPGWSWNKVRGKLNSLLILEPQGLTKTRVTYLVEVDQGGVIAKWLLGNNASNMIAGDSPVAFLTSLKVAAEADIMDESLGVDEAARLSFQKQLKKRDSFGSSIVDDIGLASQTSKADLQETVRVLESRLAELRKSERADKLDLSDLKRRVRDDLDKAKAALRAAA